jgi:hypothetical protein
MIRIAATRSESDIARDARTPVRLPEQNLPTRVFPGWGPSC